MAHPHAEHRQHKVEKRRVSHITKGYASGGAIREHHDDEENDKKLIEKSVKKTALKAEGKKPKFRADRRARGGRTKGKKGTTVNIINSPGHAGLGGAMGGTPMPPPAMAAHPPMPVPPPMPPGGAMPGAMPPGAMPPRPPMAGAMPPGGPMPIRKRGGAARGYASGGGVKDGPAWKEGVRNGTQPKDTPGKNDTKDIGRGKPITYAKGGAVGPRLVQFFAGGAVKKRATGGKVESPEGVAPATKMPGGGGGAKARLFKERRAARDYAKA